MASSSTACKFSLLAGPVHPPRNRNAVTGLGELQPWPGRGSAGSVTPRRGDSARACPLPMGPPSDPLQERSLGGTGRYAISWSRRRDGGTGAAFFELNYSEVG